MPRSPLPPAISRKGRQGRKEGNYLSSKADVVDLWCSSGKACLAYDPGAVISFLCALCVRSCGCPASSPQASSRKGRQGRKEGNYLCSKADVVELWCSSGKACLGHDPGAVISFLCALTVLFVRSCAAPRLRPASKQAHANDAKTAKKATIFVPKPTSSSCGVPRARLVWAMTRERLSLSFAPS